MQRASLRAALALAVAALAAAPARAQLDDAAKTKILSDPGYASYEAKRSDERNDETGGTMTIPAKTLAALALSALALRATADTAKGPQQTKAPSANVPQPAARNALRPDLKVSMSPDAPGQWPMQFAVVNIGGSKSDDEYLRIGVFVVGEDPVTKKSCIPRYTGSDTLIKGLAPGQSKAVQPVGLNPAAIKYMPAAPNAPPPAVKDGVLKCTFQVGASLADNGKNDANTANDVVVRNLTFTMPAQP